LAASFTRCKGLVLNASEVLLLALNSHKIISNYFVFVFSFNNFLITQIFSWELRNFCIMFLKFIIIIIIIIIIINNNMNNFGVDIYIIQI